MELLAVIERLQVFNEMLHAAAHAHPRHEIHHKVRDALEAAAGVGDYIKGKLRSLLPVGIEYAKRCARCRRVKLRIRHGRDGIPAAQMGKLGLYAGLQADLACFPNAVDGIMVSGYLHAQAGLAPMRVIICVIRLQLADKLHNLRCFCICARHIVKPG